MKKKRGFTIKIHLTNRWLYTFIALGIIVIVAVGIYAVAPNPGHTASQIEFTSGSVPATALATPTTGCSSNQFLRWDGSKWVCATPSVGTADNAKACSADDTCEIGSTISSSGRMHISGGEYLYLLNKNGVIIGKEWGGTGDLRVQGTITAPDNYGSDRGYFAVFPPLYTNCDTVCSRYGLSCYTAVRPSGSGGWSSGSSACILSAADISSLRLCLCS